MLQTNDHQVFSLNIDKDGIYSYVNSAGEVINSIVVNEKNTILTIDLTEQGQENYKITGYNISPASDEFSTVSLSDNSLSIKDTDERKGEHYMYVIAAHKATGEPLICDPQVKNDPTD